MDPRIRIRLIDFASLLVKSDRARANALSRIVAKKGFAPPYALARGLIQRYVGGNLQRADVARELKQLRPAVDDVSDKAIAIRDNIAMVQAFALHFDVSDVVLLEPQGFELPLGDVLVQGAPDLPILRAKKEQFVKLTFRKATPKPVDRRLDNVVGRLFFAAIHRTRSIDSTDVQLIDVLLRRTLSCLLPDRELKMQMVRLANYIMQEWPRLDPRHDVLRNCQKIS